MKGLKKSKAKGFKIDWKDIQIFQFQTNQTKAQKGNNYTVPKKLYKFWTDPSCEYRKFPVGTSKGFAWNYASM